MGWKDAPVVDTAAETAAAPKRAEEPPANSFQAQGYPDPDAATAAPPTSFKGAGYPEPDALTPVASTSPPAREPGKPMSLMEALGAFDDFVAPSKKTNLYKAQSVIDPYGYLYGAAQGLTAVPTGVAHFAGHPLSQAIEDWAYAPSDTVSQTAGRTLGVMGPVAATARAAARVANNHKLLTAAALYALDKVYPEWAHHAREGLSTIHLFGE